MATIVTLSALAVAACGGRSVTPGPAPEPPAEPPAAPWSGPTLAPDDVPSAYLEAWRGAENRERCALLAFRDPEPVGEARVAEFGGGWGVAWDLPGQRSAYGVAGTGVEPGPDTYDDWPHRLRWADGSEAGYGPEGGRGPNQLAYLRVSGEACLYNVWSRLGVEHLEGLLESLRLVATPPD